VLSAVRFESLWVAGARARSYLATGSRFFEPLAGALLAALMSSDRVRAAIVRAHRPLRLVGGAGLASGLATLGGPGGAPSAYAHGGALGVAASSAAIIAAVATRTSAATRLLARPAVAYL